MTKFKKNITKVRGSTSNRILLDRKKVKIILAIKNKIERMKIIFSNIFYLPNSLSNLISLRLLNDSKNYHNNKNQTLYDFHSCRILAFAKR